MPTYVYQCKNCSKKIKVVHSIKAEPNKTCPKCNTDTLERIIFAPAIHFKGSGFYSTDYKQKDDDD